MNRGVLTVSDSERKIVLFASVPNQKDLCCIVAHINPSEKRDKSAKSNFHWQILKCRQIIFSEPDIIASPVMGTENQIYILMSSEFYENGKIDVQLEKIKLTVHESIPVTNSIYEACLRYTFIARIAPLWNQVDNYLIQGRDFLTATTTLNAIKLDIGINDGEMFVVLWPTRVRLPLLKLEDLDVSNKISQDFYAQSRNYISETNLGSQWLHVLPSLKRGRLISVSHQIPDNCPFKTYKELKRHWKNLYGYRLPEDTENVVYYTLFFNPLNPTFYTYPDMCVRSQSLIFLRRVDQLGVLKAFLTDVTRKLPAVCGEAFGINPKVAYAVPKLTNISEDLVRANLSDTPNTKRFMPMEPTFLSSAAVNSFHLEENKINSISSQTDIFVSQKSYSTTLSSRNISLTTPPESGSNITNENSSNGNMMATEVRGGTPMYLQYSLFCRRTNTLTSELGKSQNKFMPMFKNKYLEPQTHPFPSQSRLPVSDITQNSEIAQDSNSLKSSLGNSIKTEIQLPSAICDTSHSSQVYKTVPPIKLKIVSCNMPLVREVHQKREGECPAITDKAIGGKKPRTRPQVQTDVDVEELARNHDLARVNTTTLVNWLREKLVPCKVKDKKSDLVDKVMAYLNLPK